jgi:inosine-uridine nucleoside N-ribohydrolase
MKQKNNINIMTQIMKKILLSIIFTILLVSISCISDENEMKRLPIIYDTDIGNDIDDVMALQMLYYYENKGYIDLIGITISKSNPYTIPYVDAYNRFNKRNKIPIGYIYEGPKKDDGRFLRQTLDTIINGEKILHPNLSISDRLPESYLLQRKLLTEKPDSSVVIVVVGSLTNIQRLLESHPDKYSCFNGLELITRKVKHLVVMGGNFDIPEKNFPEYNITKDIHSAQIVFDLWPTKIIVSGYEIGSKLLFPHQSILHDLPDSYKHPLAVSYKLFGKMPYDRPTWDLTAVLYAVEQKAGLFELSDSGLISINEAGSSRFTPSENGKHHYLLIDDEKIPLIIDELVSSVTGK